MSSSTRIPCLFSADALLLILGLLGLASASTVGAQNINVAVTGHSGSCSATSRQGLVALRAPAANSLLSLCDGHPLTSAIAGSGTPLALASADFDEDGVPDLVSGSATGVGGNVTLYRGNIAALWPYGAAAQSGPPTAFLASPHSFATPESPDFIATGDFDADGHLDIVVAKRNSSALYLLKGDGHGSFAPAKRIEVADRITDLIAGEMNQPDGLSDLIVAMAGSSGGGAVAVYQSPLGALRGQPETFALKQAVTALALGKFSGGALRDLAVGTGNGLVLIHGRNRKLSTSDAAVVPAAELSTQSLRFGVMALASGDFTGQRPSLAVLGDDSRIHILEHSVSPAAAASFLGNADAVPRMMVAGGGSDRVPTSFGSALVSSAHARAIALRRAAQVSAAEWTEQSAVSLPTGTETNAHALIPARISGSPQEDLVVVDGPGNAVHILSTVASARQKKLSAVTTGVVIGSTPHMEMLGTLSATSSPVAALPMRLSQHGLNGLVTLQSNSSVPAVTAQDVAPTAVFTVTNTLDITDVSQKSSPPAGSLRAAIENAQNAAAANGGVYSIVFNIPTSDPGYNAATGIYTIQPLSENIPNSLDYFALPPINYAVTIDGYTQPGASPNTLTAGDNAKIVIQIDGGKATTPGGAGLVPFDDSGTVIRGLAFTGWTNPNISSNNTASGAEGIEANGAGDFIEGNFFGTADGKTPLPNRIGIFVDNGPAFGSGTGNIIGGTSPQARNIISANTIYGIAFLSTAHEAQLQGNFVGLDSSGATVMGNGQDGVGMNGATITIGGTLAGARNYIAGNGYNNVDINDLTDNGAATGSYVQGNYIGTDASGTKVLSATNFGVIIDHNPTNYLIGGTTPSARNLLSGNKAGVAIYDHSFYNLVQGNYIGTDATGTLAVPNTTQGFVSGQQSSTIVPAGYTTVGGTTPGAGNVISGNLLDGVLINGTSQSSPGYTPYIGSTVQGNYIGTDATGTKALPNQGNGVSIALGGTNNTISGSNLIAYNLLNGVLIDPGTTGGPGSGNTTIANVIASNGGAGVRVKTGNGNRISANSIYSNAALGIDLDAAGPGTNSHCNATSAGANLLQNYPVLTAGTGSTYITATATDPNGNTSEFSKAVAATQAANALNLLGSFDGLPSTTFSIEFFSNPANDSSGYGQGKSYLGSTTITTSSTCSGTIVDPVDLSQADVSVVLTKPTSGLQLGADFGLIAYTAVVANNGPATAHSVTFTDVLPAQLQLSGAYCNVGSCQSPIVTSQGVCTVSGNSITCNLGTIATGASVYISIPVQVIAAGSITNVANVTATEIDPNLLNNVSSSTATASYPYPSIDHIDPVAALVNGPALPMNIYGLGFTTDSTVTFNGTTLPVLGLIDNQTCGNTFQPSFCSALQVSLPASLLTSTGSVYVSVTNPGTYSGNATFNIVSACSYSVVSLLDTNVENAGTNLIAQSVDVTTNVPSCSWTATSTVPWAVVLDEASAQGTGQVDVAFAPNTTTSTRSGSITVAGQTFNFTQDAGSSAVCNVALSPSAVAFDATGGSGTINASLSNASCAPFVEAYPDSSWITFTNHPNLLVASGPVTYKVAPNTGPARTGSISVGGNVTTITQAAPTCYFALSSSAVIEAASGETGSVTVTPSPSSCAWTATSSNSSQVTVISGASGTGVGTVNYTVAKNFAGPITPSISIGNSIAMSTFTINQASANTCTFSITPSPTSVTSSGLSSYFTVTASFSFCKWTAVSNDPDSLDITGGVSGTGTGAVYYSVAQNSGAARVLTITAGCQTFTVNQSAANISNNPTPVLTSLLPSSATAGSAAFTVTVNGTGFVAGAVVTFNGTARATTFVSATQLTAAILASDVSNAGTAPVTVTNPTPGGGTSSALTFTINAIATNPVPSVTLLQPSSVTAGAQAFTLTVNGTGFAAGAVVNFNGTARATTFVSATQLTAAILASDVSNAGTAPVTVTNPTPGGGTSSAVSLTISSPSIGSYTLSSNTAPQTIFPGGSAQYSITATAMNGTYANPIALSASGLPSRATAIFAPASLTPGSSTASSILTIQTTPAIAVARRAPGISLLASAVPLFGLLLAVKRRRIQQLLLILFALIGSIELVGCYGGISYFGDHPQTYKVTVTGTSSSTTQQSTTITIIVNY